MPPRHDKRLERIRAAQGAFKLTGASVALVDAPCNTLDFFVATPQRFFCSCDYVVGRPPTIFRVVANDFHDSVARTDDK